jgi:CBS domain-containing protein
MSSPNHEATHGRVKHPILRLEVLAPDGTHATDHVVFCRLQRQSVRVEECCGCVHCDAVGETVDCTIPTPAGPADDPLGEQTEVGSLLCRGTVVVADSVPLARALDVLRHGDRRSVAIVDARHIMVGVVHDAAFVGRLRSVHDGVVSGAMSSVVAVDERMPVRVALKLLATNHLREATVVSRNGVPIGVFHDIDGLRWIAAARREAGD